MMDRMVCADGGNPDPTSTHGKNVDAGQGARARRTGPTRSISPAGVFSVVVHGDYGGTEAVHGAIADWLRGTGLIEAGSVAARRASSATWSPTPPATTTLDRDTAFQDEVRNAARALVQCGEAHARR